MRVFGNLMNRIEEGPGGPVPEVGMGVTILMWSDRHAATISWVSENKKFLKIQRDIPTRISGDIYSESQEYTFAQDKDAAEHVYSIRKNGMWIHAGESMKNGQAIRIGDRSEYYDPSF